MTSGDWVAACLVPLALCILLSGLDDLFVDFIFLWRRLWSPRFDWPAETELNEAPRRHIAVFVPLWREQDVIGKMLDHNVAAVRYDAYDFFIGVYPNDPATMAAVEQAQRSYFHIHLAVCPHDGPTSKADCLNCIYQYMLLYEQQYGAHFDVVVTHDAEDLIDPESLRLIGYFVQTYDMVQVPVLPLRTPAREWTHGLYCDEFAEFQSKDIPVRQALGGFLPANGVGTGYARPILEKLAATSNNCVFEPACLTEDYENGYRVHALGARQLFLPIRRLHSRLVATREFFPRSFPAAIRQRTRWIIGIALQSWERHGWNSAGAHLYWFWRDRKGLLGNLLSPVANLCFLYGFAALIADGPALWEGPVAAWLYGITLLLALWRQAMRVYCVSRIYGLRFALGVPARATWGNCLNSVATVLALWRYAAARLHRRPLVWLKTQHSYPGRAALVRHKRRLGDVLVTSSFLSAADLELGLQQRRAGERLGACLIRLGKLSERRLYEALSLQQNIPLGKPERGSVARAVTRALPAQIARKWSVLPFRVAAGKLFVVTPELPSPEMVEELRRFSTLEIDFRLITPGEFEELARAYLP